MGWISMAVGGGLGALMGGPVGAAIGAAAAGSFFGEQDKVGTKCPHCESNLEITGEEKIWQCPDCDKWFIAEHKVEEDDHIIMFFAMLAKMAKMDGVVSQEEADMVSALIDEYSDERKTIAKDSFNNAKDDDKSIYFYANIFSSIVANIDDRDSILSIHYNVLCGMAMSDGILDEKEEEALRNLPFHMGISPELFDIFKKEHQDDAPIITIDEYLTILGCDTNATNQEIKQAYRKKVKENHPDTIQAKNLPDVFVETATKELQKINKAYEVIRGKRNF